MCYPRPLQERIPLLVGGSGERTTLRLAARYADACNLFAFAPEMVAQKLDVLDRHCETEGRDPAAIERTILAMGNPLDDPDGFIAAMAGYAEAGVSTVEVIPEGDPVAFTTDVMERIAPALASVGP